MNEERGHQGLELSNFLDRNDEESNRIEREYNEFESLWSESKSDHRITAERLYQIFEQTPEIVGYMSPIDAGCYTNYLAAHLEDHSRANVFRNTYAKGFQQILNELDAEEMRDAADLFRQFGSGEER